ncbi:MAG: TVP38/TMEM64 family protein [Cyclobacteriaceae bacterium]
MVAQMFLIVIPSPLLMIVSTLAYGPFWGSLISYVAVVVAATVAYFIGYHASNAFIDRLIGQKTTEKVNYYIQKYGAWAVVIFRVSPFLSNDAISFVAGLGEMKFVKFILATTAGIIPLIAMIGFLGENTERLKTGMLWISGLTIVGFAIYFLIKRHQKNKPQHAGE